MNFAFWSEHITNIESNEVLVSGVNIFGDFSTLLSSPYSGEVYIINERGTKAVNITILGTSFMNANSSLHIRGLGTNEPHSLITNLSGLQKLESGTAKIKTASFLEKQISHNKSIPICSRSGWFGIFTLKSNSQNLDHQNFHGFSLPSLDDPQIENIYIPGPHWRPDSHSLDTVFLGVKIGSFSEKNAFSELQTPKRQIKGHYPWKKKLDPLIVNQQHILVPNISNVSTSDNEVSQCTAINTGILVIENTKIRTTNINQSRASHIYINNCTIENLDLRNNKTETIIAENSKLKCVTISGHHDSVFLYNCSLNQVNLTKSHIHTGEFVSCTFSDTLLPDTPDCFGFHRSTLFSDKTLGLTNEELKMLKDIAFRHHGKTVFITDTAGINQFGNFSNHSLFNLLRRRRITTLTTE